MIDFPGRVRHDGGLRMDPKAFYKSAHWRRIASKGGKAKSPAKAAAARRNAKKGGRPRKPTSER